MNTAIASASANEVRTALCRPLNDRDKQYIFEMLEEAAERSAFGSEDGREFTIEYSVYDITAIHHYSAHKTEVTSHGGETLWDLNVDYDWFEIIYVFDAVAEESRTDIRIYLNRKY